MTLPTQYPSAWSTGKNSTDRTFVDFDETLGEPEDSKTTSASDESSMFSLAKGMLDGLGVAAGSGDATVNDETKLYEDIRTVGTPEDTAATSTTNQSMLSLAKGILARAGL